MKKALDIVTSVIKRSVDILFVMNPMGTSVGAFTGLCGEGILKVFSPALQKYKDAFDLSQLQTYHFLAAGVVLFNLPRFFRRRELPKEIEDAFEAIRRTKPQLSPVQVRMQYLALCGDVIARTHLRPKKELSYVGPRNRNPV